jgi:hypothetical protein
MATTRGAASSGLSTTDIEGIRTHLAAGRKPKVMFTESAGQIAGQVGQIVQLTDPDQSDEWLVVRFGRDELPFAPADLTVPPRGRPAGKRAGPEQAAKPAAKEPAREPAAKATAAARSTPAAKTAPVTKRGASERSSGASDAVGVRAAPAAEGAPPVPAPRDAAPADARPPAKRARPARSTKPKPPAAMTVTLAYEAGEWTVAAHQGSKTLAKPYLIRPAEALKMVAMLDVPGVHDAVEQIVTAEVTEAQRRADTLRSELAEVEARLAELRDAG